MSNSKTTLGELLSNSAMRNRGVDSLITTKREAPKAKLPYPEVGVAHSPLTRAIIHLLRIGSTSQSELQMMAKEFITEEDACEKFNLVRRNEKLN